MDSHSSGSNYHDSWETRSSYPERDRYPERDTRDPARDSSFERRHGERDRRDNRERGNAIEMKGVPAPGSPPSAGGSILLTVTPTTVGMTKMKNIDS